MPKDFKKVNTEQIFMMWRNVAISCLALIVLHVMTMSLPAIFAPVVSTVCAGFLYFQIFSASSSRNEICPIFPYALFITVLSYTILLIALNLLDVWGIITLPVEMVFFDGVYLQSLLLAPTGLVTCTILYLRRHRLALCVSCKIQNGSPIERGRVGLIYSSEFALQLRNLIGLYTVITAAVWLYYWLEYFDASITSRDRFMFTGIALVVYLGDIFYFGMRYYNLYLDLKERDELVSPAELSQIGTRTYVRFYVISNDSVYLSAHSLDGLRDDDSDIIDTPFMIKRTMSGVQEYELKQYIEKQTGVRGGELRFFYGRKRADAAGRRVLRYFYFLPEELDDHPALDVDGEWISSEKLKTIYNNAPDRMAAALLADISRLATIIVTSKTYNDHGERRTKLVNYRPSFTLSELRRNDIDFQDDKWIRISIFNSDTAMFRLKRWWYRRMGRAYSTKGEEL